MEKLTDNEIIKALECCRSDTRGCKQCPMFEDCGKDIHALEKYALDLINRQNEEIERLLRAINDKHCVYEKRVVTEAIKEFAEKSENKLIEIYEKYHKIANKPKKETDMFYQGRAEAIWECITINRDLIKEMVGDEKVKYRKKPVVVEAFRLGIDYIPDWFMDKVTTNDVVLHGKSSGFEHYNDTNADIKTLEGIMHANFGDFIIRGVNGELYPCKPDIFEKTYEMVGDAE